MILHKNNNKCDQRASGIILTNKTIYITLKSNTALEKVLVIAKKLIE